MTTCKDCIYFKKIKPVANMQSINYGECRLNPPTQSITHISFRPQQTNRYRTVYETDWCGQFEPIEEEPDKNNNTME